MDKHITILGIIYTALGALGLLGASIVFLALGGVGVASGDAEAAMFLGGLGMVVAGFIALVSLPGLIAGIGLLQRKPWSRIVALVVGFLNLINIPIGTAIGGYAIWVLLQDESARLLSGDAAAHPVALA
jgi:hypothetical protein